VGRFKVRHKLEDTPHITYSSGKISMDWSGYKVLAKASGLKSKSVRKIYKRVKILINDALWDYIDEQEESRK